MTTQGEENAKGMRNRRLRQRDNPFVKVWDLPTMQVVLVVLDKEAPRASVDSTTKVGQVSVTVGGVLR